MTGSRFSNGFAAGALGRRPGGRAHLLGLTSRPPRYPRSWHRAVSPKALQSGPVSEPGRGIQGVVGEFSTRKLQCTQDFLKSRLAAQRVVNRVHLNRGQRRFVQPACVFQPIERAFRSRPAPSEPPRMQSKARAIARASLRAEPESAAPCRSRRRPHRPDPSRREYSGRPRPAPDLSPACRSHPGTCPPAHKRGPAKCSPYKSWGRRGSSRGSRVPPPPAGPPGNKGRLCLRE